MHLKTIDDVPFIRYYLTNRREIFQARWYHQCQNVCIKMFLKTQKALLWFGFLMG